MNLLSIFILGFSPEAAEWIVKSGKVTAVGVDVVSLDNGQSKIFKSHTILLSANISGYEMVANLDKLPPAGAMVYGAPIKIKDGTGGASRIFADIGKHEKCDKQRTEVFLTHRTVYLLSQSKFFLLISNAPFSFFLFFFAAILIVKKTNN